LQRCPAPWHNREVKALYGRFFALAGAAAAAGCGMSAASPPARVPANFGAVPSAIAYTFKTLDDPNDTNFTELLSINDDGRIAGYYGSGSASNPWVGFTIYPPYGRDGFERLQYPDAPDTIATAVADKKTVVGYFVKSGKIEGFAYTNQIWDAYQDPRARGTGSKTEFYGLNNSNLVVGIYESASGSGSFELNLATNDFDAITAPVGSGIVAEGITDNGNIAGYMSEPSGSVVGFIRDKETYTYIIYPYATTTKLYAINADNDAGGSYVDGNGVTHGFIVVSPLVKGDTVWETVDDPKAVGITVVTGINLRKQLVGYYVDGHNRTHGFLATPSSAK
jgi:hypothetical protein